MHTRQDYQNEESHNADLSHVVAVCSIRLRPVYRFDPRFESMWRSRRHRRLRSRSKLRRKRSCLPLQVALRVSWTFPVNFK